MWTERAGRLACTFAFAAACSSSSAPQQPAAPAPPASKCAHVADHLLSLMSPTAREAPVEELDRVRGELKRRCEDDGWSLDAQQCFLELEARDQVDRCASKLTEAQMRALEQPAEPADSPNTGQ